MPTPITTANLDLAGPPNVRTYGAKMDGSQDDSPAFNAARAGVQSIGRVLEIPAGPLSLWSGWPTAGADGVLWHNGSSNQLQFFGGTDDVIESFVDGSKYFGMGQTRHGSPPPLRVDQKVTHTFNTDGKVNQETVIPAVKFNQTTDAVRLDDFPWVLSVTSRTRSYGKGQAVGIGSQMIREKDSLNDGNGPRNQMWGAYIEVGDETERPANESGSLVGIEMGIFATGAAPDGSGGRFGIDIGIGRHSHNGSGEANRVNRGINFGCADSQYDRPDGGKWQKHEQSYFGRVIAVAANWDIAAFDTTDGLALGGAPAIKISEGHKIAFEASGQKHVRYEAGAIRFSANNSENFNVEDNGNFNAAGRGRFPRLSLTGLPTSPLGLTQGEIWVDIPAGNLLRIV